MSTPLKPEPDWTFTPGAGYHDRRGGSTLNDVRHAYGKGFEDGAFALAEQANKLLSKSDVAGLVALLHTYKNGQVKPTDGWHFAPRRN